MAVDTTSTLAPIFVTDEPDYSLPMQLTSSYHTTVATSTDGSDQRARWRGRPRYAIAYAISGMTARQFARRRSKQISELIAPCVVPIWTDRIPITSMSSPTITVNLSSQRKFKVGCWIYLTQAGQPSAFRKISGISISGTVMTMTLTDEIVSFGQLLTTEGGLIITTEGGLEITVNVDFTSAGFVYPCLTGKRTAGKCNFQQDAFNNTTENVAYEEL